MPARTSYAQGTPNWVDLQTTDQPAAKAFYAELFGWEYDDQHMPEGGGATYSMARKNGGMAAAIAPQPPDMAAAGVPPMWNTYLAVDSLDDAVAKVPSAGGQVMLPPFAVMDAGRMAWIIDPSGAGVALWQANQHIGATIVNEHGSLCWNELITDEASTAVFYQQVLGLTTSQQDMGGDPYTTFEVGGNIVGGTVKPYQPGTPNHWHVYFAVDDADQTAATTAKLGGQVLVEPFDTPVGRIAVLRDPQGAVFSVLQPAGPTS